jgi:hypothetical protein
MFKEIAINIPADWLLFGLVVGVIGVVAVIVLAERHGKL